MKHITKKFLIELPKDKMENLTTNMENLNGLNLTKYTRKKDGKNIQEKLKKNTSLHFIESGDVAILSSHLKIDGHYYPIPLPDFTILYFNSAYNNIKKIDSTRKELLSKLNMSNDNSEDFRNDYYEYFHYSTGFIIYMFTSIECYLNSVIGDAYDKKKYVYKRNNKLKSEIFTKSGIEKDITFDEKINKILPDINKSKFNKIEIITKLKLIRDEIIHTKSDMSNINKLINDLMIFKYENCILCVRDFMNFYKPNYIEECNCGKYF